MVLILSATLAAGLVIPENGNPALTKANCKNMCEMVKRATSEHHVMRDLFCKAFAPYDDNTDCSATCADGCVQPDGTNVADDLALCTALNDKLLPSYNVNLPQCETSANFRESALTALSKRSNLHAKTKATGDNLPTIKNEANCNFWCEKVKANEETPHAEELFGDYFRKDKYHEACAALKCAECCINKFPDTKPALKTEADCNHWCGRFLTNGPLAKQWYGDHFKNQKTTQACTDKCAADFKDVQTN